MSRASRSLAGMVKLAHVSAADLLKDPAVAQELTCHAMGCAEPGRLGLRETQSQWQNGGSLVEKS